MPDFFGRAFGACLRFRAQNAFGNPLVEAQKAFFSGAPSARIYPSLQYSIIVPQRKLQQGRPHLREALFSQVKYRCLRSEIVFFRACGGPNIDIHQDTTARRRRAKNFRSKPMFFYWFSLYLNFWSQKFSPP